MIQNPHSTQETQRRLKELYKRYGFEFAKGYADNTVLVFTIKNGYFQNADIVPLLNDSDTTLALNEFQQLGYACQVRTSAHPEIAESQLFQGFFSLESVIERLRNDYRKFTKSIVSIYSDKAEYKYINAPYQINGDPGEKSPAEEVITRLGSEKPILFLIEAAAGFGKTCTAYELVSHLVEKGDYLPLFSELSRNRQAVIFRHILLDEIDHTFPILSSKLVQSEMKNGKIVTILDGFDELLRKTDDGEDFGKSEPMLETIGEFLTGRAKIVLTTRRTVLFEGDPFHLWVEKHAESFELVRIRINEPNVEHWLQEERLSKVVSEGIDLEAIANPVILSYLRCIPDDDFNRVANDPNGLIEKYFDFMLDRERIRQDLRITPEKQQEILLSIAQDMVQLSYTSEQRDYIVEYIIESNSRILDEALKNYSPAERPSKEALANKLASHALLDRSSDGSEIGFINEFVLGNFIAQIIMSDPTWLNDEIRFIEPAVISYQPRSAEKRNTLWSRLKPSSEFLSMSDRVDIVVRLIGSIPFILEHDEVQAIEFKRIEVGELLIKNFQFNECTFKNCNFKTSNLDNVTFLNCKYYECTISEDESLGQIFILGSMGETEFIKELEAASKKASITIPEDRMLLAEGFILEKFWPAGRSIVTHKHRPIKGVCANSGEFTFPELYDAITSLKRKSILRTPKQSSFLEINIEEIEQIKQILRRD